MSKKDKGDDSETFSRDPQKEAEMNRGARRERAKERLHVKNPRCVHCGENDPLVLERHHVAGRPYDETTVVLCRNCHRKLSDDQKDHPPRIDERPDALERVAHFLLGLADLFELLIGKLREFAAELIGRADPNRENSEPVQ